MLGSLEQMSKYFPNTVKQSISEGEKNRLGPRREKKNWLLTQVKKPDHFPFLIICNLGIFKQILFVSSTVTEAANRLFVRNSANSFFSGAEKKIRISFLFSVRSGVILTRWTIVQDCPLI
jgi:hypothetical protein